MMEHGLTLEKFLATSGISQNEWDRSKCDWVVLEAIARHFELQKSELESTGQLVANLLQKIPQVHSVRWRVKDTMHLLAKIVRKCSDDTPQMKYTAITVDNYMEAVTDLVGVRALHLFKDECFAINTAMHQRLNIEEGPIAYIRAGDGEDVTLEFHSQKFDVKEHKSGYRSVHYVIASQPFKAQVKIEVQVRTIFEEAWSEIDHKVRYPNFSDNELLSYFLAIFNRLAGSADEMGSYAKDLSIKLNQYAHELTMEKEEKEKLLLKMEHTVAEIGQIKTDNQLLTENVQKLKDEMSQLRASKSLSSGGLLGGRLDIQDGLPRNFEVGGWKQAILDTESLAARTIREQKKLLFTKETLSPSVTAFLNSDSKK